jgi:hypothetical protein
MPWRDGAKRETHPFYAGPIPRSGLAGREVVTTRAARPRKTYESKQSRIEASRRRQCVIYEIRRLCKY